MSIVVRKLVAVLGLQYNKGSFREINATLGTIKDTMGAVVDLFNMGSRALQNFLVVAARREALEVSFGVLFKNVELGKQKLAELDKFAAETPLSVAQVRKNAVMLTAMGTSVEELIPEMKVLSNIVAAFPNLTLERLALNFGQVRAQGHLTGREWRDFAVGGIDVLTPIAKKLNKTKTELRDMMSKRLISFDMVKQAFVEMASEGGMAYQMLEKQAETAKGMWAILKSNILLIKEAIGTELLPAFKEMLSQIIQWVKLNKDVIVKAVLIYLDTLTGFIRVLFFLLKGIVKLVPPLHEIVEALKMLVFLLGIAALGALTVKISALTVSFAGLGAAIVAATTALDAFLIKMTLVMTPFVKVAGIITAIGLAIASLFYLFESADLYFRGLFEGFKTKTIFGDMFGEFPIVLAIMHTLIAALRTIVGLFLVLTTDMTLEDLANDAVIKKFSDTVKNAWSEIIDTLHSRWNLFIDFMGLYLSNRLRSIINWFIEQINGIIGGINTATSILPFGDKLQISNVQKLEGMSGSTGQSTKYINNYVNAVIAEGESGNFMKQINDASDEFNSGPMNFVEER